MKFPYPRAARELPRCVAAPLCALSLSMLLSGCAVMSCHVSPKSKLAEPAFLERRWSGYRIMIFAPKGNPPPKAILILHELSGVTTECADFAELLAAEGFTVFVPVLLGNPFESGELAILWNSLSATFSGRWHSYSQDQSPEILPALREIVAEIRAETGGASVGLIGMCLNGAVPLALMSEPGTRIAALCHPALPKLAWNKHRRASLGLSKQDLDPGIARICKERLLVMGFRFKHDKLSTPERFDTVSCLLKDGGIFEPCIIANSVDDKRHSIFTREFDSRDGTEIRGCFDYLVAQFHAAL